MKDEDVSEQIKETKALIEKIRQERAVELEAAKQPILRAAEALEKAVTEALKDEDESVDPPVSDSLAKRVDALESAMITAAKQLTAIKEALRHVPDAIKEAVKDELKNLEVTQKS